MSTWNFFSVHFLVILLWAMLLTGHWETAIFEGCMILLLFVDSICEALKQKNGGTTIVNGNIL